MTLTVAAFVIAGHDMIKGNLSQFAKELRNLGSATIFKRAGQALKESIEDDFDTMLMQTPQYSGSTVASYRIGLAAEDTYDQLPEPASANDAFERGHETAVNIARVANAGAIPEDYKGYLRKDLIITNGSPQWDVTEYGPVRDVNEPAGAFERFKQRLETKIIDVDLGDL